MPSLGSPGSCNHQVPGAPGWWLFHTLPSFSSDTGWVHGSHPPASPTAPDCACTCFCRGYVHASVCMQVCACATVCVHCMSVCACPCKRVQACMCARVCACVCERVCVCVCMSVHVRVSVCKHVCACVCRPFEVVAFHAESGFTCFRHVAFSCLPALRSFQTSVSTTSFLFQAWRPFATSGCRSRGRGGLACGPGSLAPRGVMLRSSQCAGFLHLITQDNNDYCHCEA